MSAVYDHSAPWRCSLPWCQTCEGKPTYGEWWVAVNARQIEPRVKRVRVYPRCYRCDDVARWQLPLTRGGASHYWCDDHRPHGNLALGYLLRLRRVPPRG